MFRRYTLWIAGLVLSALFVSACAITAPTVSDEKPEWTFVVLPDTQHYAEDYPESFYAQTNWLRNEAKRGALDLVLHVGDVVDENEDVQWDVASQAFRKIDGVVPYVLSAGNHDFAYDGTRNSLFSDYFPTERFELNGTYEEGRGENAWRFVQLGEMEYLVLSLEVFPRDDVIVWASDVLVRHVDYPTIIITHAYLYNDGLRYGEPGAPDHAYGPESIEHVTGTGFGVSNDAETMYRELVAPFSQVVFVLSGHVLGSGVARRTDVRADGSVVHSVLQNYQMRESGGEGYLRIYIGYEDRIEVSTYSPLLDRRMRDAENEFVLRTK